MRAHVGKFVCTFDLCVVGEHLWHGTHAAGQQLGVTRVLGGVCCVCVCVHAELTHLPKLAPRDELSIAQQIMLSQQFEA